MCLSTLLLKYSYGKIQTTQFTIDGCVEVITFVLFYEPVTISFPNIRWKYLQLFAENWNSTNSLKNMKKTRSYSCFNNTILLFDFGICSEMNILWKKADNFHVSSTLLLGGLMSFLWFVFQFWNCHNTSLKRNGSGFVIFSVAVSFKYYKQ